MPKLIELEQGSPEWLEFRTHGIGGSDAPIIMGASPWCDAHTLWLRKRGEAPEQFENDAMRRGKLLEAEARERYETLSGLIFQPQVFQHDTFHWMIASLDGITADGKEVLEIKCPSEANHHEWIVPEKYLWQLIHQAEVTQCERVHYVSYRPGAKVPLWNITYTGSFLRERAPQLIEAEAKFWQQVQTGTPPETAERTDEEWCNAALDYRDAMAALKDAEEAVEREKQRLLKLAGGKSAFGKGVKITFFEKKGSVEYKKIPELSEVDLEAYRKPATTDTRITLSKDLT